MFLHSVAASALILSFVPAITAEAIIPPEIITQISSSLYTVAQCTATTFIEVPGIYYVGTTPFCGCITDDAGPDVCGGSSGSIVAACLQTETTYLSSAANQTATCTTSSCAQESCEQSVVTTVEFDSACAVGEGLYLETAGSSQFCTGCIDPNDVVAGSIACTPPGNSSASCTTTTSSLWNYGGTSHVTQVASCEFTCLPLYETSPDGTGCVLIPPTLPYDTILSVQSALYTLEYCEFGDSPMLPGIYSLDGVDVCGCVLPEVGVPICPMNAPACASSTTNYAGQPPSYTAACTTCDTNTCDAVVTTAVQYDSGCPAGKVLYIAPDGSCSCANLENIPISGSEICPTIDNSDTTCTNTVMQYRDGNVDLGTCGLVCVFGYQTSTDGTSCVLSPVVGPTGLPSGPRRNLREMVKRRRTEMIF